QGRAERLVAAAAGASASRRDLVRAPLEDVRERLELRRLAAAAMRERLGEEPVREPRVARQERPVEVRPDHPAGATALEAALAVVPEAGEDAAERLGAGIEA